MLDTSMALSQGCEVKAILLGLACMQPLFVLYSAADEYVVAVLCSVHCVEQFHLFPTHLVVHEYSYLRMIMAQFLSCSS